MNRFSRLFLLFALCWVMGSALSGCTREEMRQSVSQGLKKSCSNNADRCTVTDDDSVRPDGKGAQR